jgi:Protein affecting phage T7 exclusion by the F plasmid
MRFLLPSLLVLPVLEMYVLIKVGAQIGAMTTIFLVLLTAFVGLFLLRQQGFRTLFNAKTKIERAELPLEEIFAGIFLAIGGALLLTPGFITDFIGFLCLVPSTRKVLISLIVTYFFNSFSFSPRNKKKKSDWIEGEYKKEE